MIEGNQLMMPLALKKVALDDSVAIVTSYNHINHLNQENQW